MAIMKNDIPILEYDADPLGVIMPDHEHININLPKKAVFAFLRDDVDRYAKEHNAVAVAHFESATKEYPVYLLDVDGQQICLVQAPVGAPAATQILDWLIAYGVRELISCGSCGVLVDIPENAFLVPYKALRDEGTSYHYLPPERFVEVSEKARYAIEKTMKNHGLPYMEVVTWSTDGFFRETKEKVAYRKSEGCSVVEMECSAMQALCDFRGTEFFQFFYAGDNLDHSNWDPRSLSGGARLDDKTKIMFLAFELGLKIVDKI